MKTVLLTVFFLSSALFADSSAAYPPNPFETQGGKRTPVFSEANARAIYWINLIDQHQFHASWFETSGLVQDITTPEQWGAAMEATRLNHGTVRSRKVLSHHMAAILPRGTKGNFIIIEYATNYSRSPNMLERITLMTEGPLNQWRVVAYTIGKP